MIKVSFRVCSINTFSLNQGLGEAGTQVVGAVREILELVERSGDNLESLARDLCESIAHTYIAALLLGKDNISQ